MVMLLTHTPKEHNQCKPFLITHNFYTHTHTHTHTYSHTWFYGSFILCPAISCVRKTQIFDPSLLCDQPWGHTLAGTQTEGWEVCVCMSVCLCLCVILYVKPHIFLTRKLGHVTCMHITKRKLHLYTHLKK